MSEIDTVKALNYEGIEGYLRFFRGWLAAFQRWVVLDGVVVVIHVHETRAEALADSE